MFQPSIFRGYVTDSANGQPLNFRDDEYLPVVPHKAVAEVSRIGNL